MGAVHLIAGLGRLDFLDSTGLGALAGGLKYRRDADPAEYQGRLEGRLAWFTAGRSTISKLRVLVSRPRDGTSLAAYCLFQRGQAGQQVLMGVGLDPAPDQKWQGLGKLDGHRGANARYLQEHVP
jgi:hypothetical protein